MKMVYERPMMQAEQYVTNAYCNVCTSRPILETTITTSADPADWFSPNSGNTISSNRLEGYALGHTFNQGAAIEMTRPEGVYGAGETQYYWVCSCTDCANKGDRYYLEYSAEWADDSRYEGKNIFVLYKENTNDNDLDIVWTNGGNLPDGGSGWNEKGDYGIGATFVSIGQTVVDNS